MANQYGTMDAENPEHKDDATHEKPKFSKKAILIGVVSLAAVVVIAIVAGVGVAVGEGAQKKDGDASVKDITAQKWAHFKTKYNKQYVNSDVEAYRLNVFKSNLALAEKRNTAGNGLGKHGMTKFSDLTPKEFSESYLGYEKKTMGAQETSTIKAATKAPKDIDWRDRHAVTPVKNQGQCGSCWAFSATEEIETMNFLKNGFLPVLSPQQITSCDTIDGVLGCNGGDTYSAYQYVEKKGIETNKAYPYKSGNTQSTGQCKYSKKKVDADVQITGYTVVSSSAEGEKKMATQIQSSPISICLDATAFQTYTGGIIGAGCGQQVDHCVQAVGIGSSGSTKYWIVRNSWGTDWGYDGYGYVQYGINACNIASTASIVTVEDDASTVQQRLFNNFKADYQKTYTAEQEAVAFTNFKANLALASKRNGKVRQRLGEHGVTPFFDISVADFNAKFKGFKGNYAPSPSAPSPSPGIIVIEGPAPSGVAPSGSPAPSASSPAPSASSPAPSARPTPAPGPPVAKVPDIDWRPKGAVSPVKNQGQCGSCWAFSATEQIESNNFLKTGHLPILSPQQITSCDTINGVQGCNGGYTSSAYDYVVKNGIESNKDYPYTSGGGSSGTCDYTKADVDIHITGFNSISSSAADETKMATQIQQSPISICLDATAFQTYTGGILGQGCGQQVDHCVQTVGIGTDSNDGIQYWIVRNSWATSWGIDGYGYVQYGINACNIASTATTANI